MQCQTQLVPSARRVLDGGNPNASRPTPPHPHASHHIARHHIARHRPAPPRPAHTIPRHAQAPEVPPCLVVHALRPTCTAPSSPTLPVPRASQRQREVVAHAQQLLRGVPHTAVRGGTHTGRQARGAARQGRRSLLLGYGVQASSSEGKATGAASPSAPRNPSPSPPRSASLRTCPK